MKNKITYHWGEDHLLINLGNQTEPRIRVLFWAEFLLTIGMATIFLMESLPLSISFTHWIAGMGVSVLYLLAAYRFLSRILYSERIVLDQKYFTIIQRTPFSRQQRKYDWRNVGELHYLGKEAKTAHPLKGNCYDYFGFETQEHLIQSLHQDGNLFFNFSDYPVRFARGVHSWHAEEMVRMMKLYAGNTLRLGPEWAHMLEEQEFGDA